MLAPLLNIIVIVFLIFLVLTWWVDPGNGWRTLLIVILVLFGLGQLADLCAGPANNKNSVL